MQRIPFWYPAALLLACAGCPAAGDVVVEVLPPRTSVTCAAPTKADAALGRGLLDVLTTLGSHGGYVGDLRLSFKGADARVSGVEFGYAFSTDNSAVADAIDAVTGVVATGDVVLDGSGDDLRVGVLENVPLVPRELAVAIQAAGVGLSKTEFESIDIEIKPEVDGVVALTASSFSVDVCAGCLTQPADACSADAQHAFNPIVCRPGQDVPSFTCLDVTIGVAP